MRIASKIFAWKQRGYALLITITFIALTLSLLAGLLSWTNGSSLQTQRNNLFRSSTGAADAATSLAMAYMWRDFYNQNFNSASNYTSYLPNQNKWPQRFSFSDGSGNADETGVITAPSNWTTNWQSLNAFGPPYSGLSAFVEQCLVTSTATTSNSTFDVSATVRQRFELASIPLFQFAVFYNLDMEIDPGAALTLSGPVFSNGGIWARGLGTYNSSISAVQTVSTNSTDPYVSGKSDANGSTFNQGLTTNANSMTLPIGVSNNATATRALLGVPPSGVAPYSEAGQEYFENEANIIISNSSSGKLSAFYQDPNAVTPLTAVPYDLTNVTSTGSGNNITYTTNYAYSFATNVTFYDYREVKTVHAVQLDVGALNTYLGKSTGLSLNNKMNFDNGHSINSVYVDNNVPMSSSVLPAVRVSDGSVLPAQGLTVVTPDPLYVLGDYNANGQSLNNGANVANTKPAALIADAITVLSPGWSDSYTASTPLSNRTPTATTVNAATLEGIVESSNGNYSGGVENFLRLLENWNTSVPLTYNGSIVVMFPSQYATAPWSYGSYYTAAKRVWAFDVNFLSQKGLPPLTPAARAIIRQSWAVY